MLGPNGSLAKFGQDDDSENGIEDPDDEDLRNDPIYNLDIQVSIFLIAMWVRVDMLLVCLIQTHLVQFFQQAYSNNINSFRQLTESYLNEQEKAVLGHVLSMPA